MSLARPSQTNAPLSGKSPSVVVPQSQNTEEHVLKTLTLGDGDSDQGVRLPAVGSIRKLIIKVDTSGVSFTAGTTPALVTRAGDLWLKTFTLTISDNLGKREVISGTYCLMAHRQVRRTKKNASSVYGEFIFEFPVKHGLNSMLPAGISKEFTMDYTVGSISELATGSPTAIDGIVVTITAIRYQKVFIPNSAIIYKTRTVVISQTGDKEVEFSNAHLYTNVAFIQYNTSDALADIVNKIVFENNGRTIADLRPKPFRARMNDEVGSAPDSGILFLEPNSPVVSQEMIATLDVSNATDVECLNYTEEVLMA